MKNNRVFEVLKSDLSYLGGESVVLMTEIEFSNIPLSKGVRYDGVAMFKRIGYKKSKMVKYDNFCVWYHNYIAEESGLTNWKQNKWFVEQVKCKF